MYPHPRLYIPCTYGNVYAAYVRENLNEGEVLPRYVSKFFEIARSYIITYYLHVEARSVERRRIH